MQKKPNRLIINTLTQPRPTLWAMAITALAGLAVAILLLSQAGCSKGGSGDQAKAAQSSGGNGQKKDGGQRGRPSQPPVPIAVSVAGKGEIASYYSATATLTAEKEAEVLSRTAGVSMSLHCEEGDWVEKGDRLFQIQDSEYRLRLAQAEATTASLKDRHERMQGMFKQHLVSAQEFEGVKNELKAAEAAEGLARLNLSYTTVRAPFSGRVVRRLVDIGQNISVGTPLFVISDFDPLLAAVHVPSKEFKKLKADQSVAVILDSNKDMLEGRIKLVSPIIDPASGTIKVTVEIRKYPVGTRPGDFAEVRIVTEKRYDTVLVPKIAVFTDRGDRVAFVAADSTAERRVVEIGFEDNANTEILSGIFEGERVVVKGQRSLKHGAPIKIMDDTAAPPSAAEETKETQRAGS